MANDTKCGNIGNNEVLKDKKAFAVIILLALVLTGCYSRNQADPTDTESKEFLDHLTTRDQRMMLVIITMVITADSKEELDNETEALKTIAQNRMCQIATLNYQQMYGLKTVLPIGVWKINAFRTLTTESLLYSRPLRCRRSRTKAVCTMVRTQSPTTLFSAIRQTC